jgi:site-specific DNA-adenine methylase
MLERAHALINDKQVRITKLDYKEVLSELGENDFAYLDPPYKDSDVRAYESANIDHAELVDILKSAKFRWALSEYKHPIYLEAFGEPGWQQERTITYGRGADRPKRIATECLWSSAAFAIAIEEAA